MFVVSNEEKKSKNLKKTKGRKKSNILHTVVVVASLSSRKFYISVVSSFIHDVVSVNLFFLSFLLLLQICNNLQSYVQV